MKKLQRVLSTVLVVLVMSIFSVVKVEAGDVAESSPEAAYYDLEKGGTQSFQLTDENGEEAYVVVEEVPGLSRVANGTYRVSYTCTGAWQAGFQVNISGNKITRAHSSYHKALAGTIGQTNLTRDNSTMASYRFFYQLAGVGKSTGVRGSISGGKLRVSKI